MFGFVFLFQLLNYCEFSMGFEAMALAAEVLAGIYAIWLVGIVSVLIYSDIHRPFALTDVLDSADDAFHKVDDPLAFAVYLMEDFIRFVCSVALKFLGPPDLPTAFIVPFG